MANALEFAGRVKIISQDTDGKNKSILTGKITGQNITVKNLTVNEDLTIDKQKAYIDFDISDLKFNDKVKFLKRRGVIGLN